VRVLVAPDSFGGRLTAPQVAGAVVEGWLAARPEDRVTALPLSDGGEGFLDVAAGLHPDAVRSSVEVADATSRPRTVDLLRLANGTVVIESARVCGLRDVPVDERRPLEATTYGVGQVLQHALDLGARRIVLGLGGTATIDAGSGALNGLGFRLTTAEGEGLRIGAGSLGTCVSVEPGWSRWPEDIELVLLADVRIPLVQAVARYGPQKGLARGQVADLEESMGRFAAVLTERFPGPVDATTPGTGAAGGLGFGLAVALGGRFHDGAAWYAERAGLEEALAAADLVITGEGRLDATTADGKLVAHVVSAARQRGVTTAILAGVVDREAPGLLGVPDELVVAAPSEGPHADASDAVAALRRASRTLADRLTSVH